MMNNTISVCDRVETLSHSSLSIVFYFQVCAILFLLAWAHRKISWLHHPLYNDPGAPPVVPYYIPIIGVTASFWMDMLGFFQYWSKKYDTDIFGGYMGGKPYYFVNDHLAAAHLVSGRIPGLSWVEAKYRMLKNGLGGSHDAAYSWTTEADLKNEHAIVEKHLLNGKYLNETLFQYQEVLEKEVIPDLMKFDEERGWKREGILKIVGRAIYYSTIETVFGYNSLKNEADYDTTMIFERRFPMFTGMNSKLLQMRDYKGYSAREIHVQKMKEIFSKIRSPSYSPSNKNDDFFSDLVKEYGEYSHKTMSDDDIARFHYLFLCASYFNTIPAGFWAFFEMLRDPNALEACKNEVFAAKTLKDQKNLDSENEERISKYFTLTELDNMDILESLITEAMRLRSTSKMIRLRYSNEDFRLKLPLPLSGKVYEFDVRKGTYFVSCPTLMHRDPEIFEDPMTFKYDRFAKDANGKLPIFKKNGRRIHRPVDAFGGGQTMCPGRRFAVSEIKSLIATILLEYDIRWPNGEIPEPPVDTWGIVNTGMPTRDIQFEFRKRGVYKD